MIHVRILRHPRENLDKCTLQPLAGDPRFEFLTWDAAERYDASAGIVLELDAPMLTARERGSSLWLLDSTWRYLPKMRACLTGRFHPRSLPAIPTAYPRIAKLSANPTQGLASIEALYAALRVLGERDDSLLAGYHWREAFLAHCAAAGL